MSDIPIAVGDLVVVINQCCPEINLIGTIFRVLGGREKETKCSRCQQLNVGLHFSKTTTVSQGIPVSWIKRIPPLDELEGKRTEESLKEPA